MGENRYFNLDPKKCNLVKGYCGAAIYDFVGGTVFSVPPELIKLIHPVLHCFVLDFTDNYLTNSFFKFLQVKALGRFDSVLPEKEEVMELKNEVTPDFCWLEITPDCNLHCVHCYGSFGSAEHVTSGLLTVEEWKKIIREIKALGFSRIQFIGGEPLLCLFLPELLFEAGGMGFSVIEVFSNLVLLDEPFLNALCANNVNLATTIYSVNPRIHDHVTGHQGSFETTLCGLRKAVAWGIPVRAGCIITSVSEGQVGDVQRLVEESGGYFGGYDQVRPSGRGDKTLCNSTIPQQVISPPFFTNQEKFNESKSFNPCWKGKMTVTADGDVIPCIFSRDCIAGNVRHTSLHDIVRDDNGLNKYWRFSKDKVEVCRDCEFRYACPDCRPLAVGWNNGNIHAKTYGCRYTPYSAVWK